MTVDVRTFPDPTGHRALTVQASAADRSGVTVNPLVVEQANTQKTRDFIFRLESGKALLEQGRTAEAKSVFELSLALEPRDVEAQSLLGLVYFRLGQYERAAATYEHLEQVCPTEITPKFNLALSYLKTGNLEAARMRLEHVVAQAPDHTRAWAYLGVARQRLGEAEGAALAFDRAGRTRLAFHARQSLATDRTQTTAPTRPRPGANTERAPAIAQHEIDDLALPPSSQVSRTTDLPEGVEEGTSPYYQLGSGRDSDAPEPETDSAAAVSRHTSLLSADDWFQAHQLNHSSQRFMRHLGRGRLSCAYAGVLHVRQHFVRAVFPDAEFGEHARHPVDFDWSTEPVLRLLGSGVAVLEALRQHLHFVELAQEPLYFRRSSVVGYSGHPTLTRQCLQPDWLSLDVVRLDPEGPASTVVFSTHDEPLTMPIAGPSKALVCSDWLLGWYGQLMIMPDQPGSGLLSIHGTGGVFLDPGSGL